MKRKIIQINKDLCTGCAECESGCSEGAIQVIEGKARLIKEDFCDGFGDCIGTCPTGALTIIEKEAPDFDEEAVKEHLLKTQGEEAVLRMQRAQEKHRGGGGGGCPGHKQIKLSKENKDSTLSDIRAMSVQAIPSELGQWPVQLHLVNAQNPHFQNKELVILSTCSPLASADVHWKYLRGRSIVVACPKLDRVEPYVAKLADIFKEKSIPKVIILRMEVPCCAGLTQMASEARGQCGRDNLDLEEHVLGVEGNLNEIKKL